MFDLKANFKTKYQGILQYSFCKIDEEFLEHIFVCPDGPICKFSDNVSGHLDNLMSLKDWHWITTKTRLVFAEI